MDTSTHIVSSINGVSTYNKAGKLKSKYTNDQRLQILGETSEELQAFIELFCPDSPHYAITRAKSTNPRDWTTPKGRVSATDILNHLLGNLLPGKNPRWVAPRSWEATWWVGIDVDLRKGNYTDFTHRCKRIRRALKQLGVCNKHLLVSNTPSGGKHYRFFLTHKIKVCEIENIFRRVGIEECSGKFELFPRTKKGMRLPFGYLPEKQFQQKAWLKFIRDFQKGEFPLVNWWNCVANSLRFLDPHGLPVNPDTRTKTSATAQPLTHELNSCGIPVSDRFGVPKRIRLQKPVTSIPDQDEYIRLLSKNRDEFRATDARRIWELGILDSGTRVDATKKMAWHLCHRKRFAPKEVVRLLVDWVYQTGAQTSHEVQQDLAEGTRKVEEQTREIVAWHAANPPTQHARIVNHSLFSKAEVDEVKLKLLYADVESRQELLEFALNFLRYAKLHGEATLEGWEASITAAKVMRKWPGSGGSKYKQKRDFLEKLGLVIVTRKEWKTRHGGGRARTYLMKVPPTLSAGASLTTAEALQYAQHKISQDQIPSVAAIGNRVQVDSYKRVEEQPKGIGHTEVGNPRDLIQTDHTDLRDRHPDGSRQAGQLQATSVSSSPTTNAFEELQKEFTASARESLRLPYLSESRHANPPPTSPHSPSPLDLASLVELGLSSKALDYLTNRPSQLGIPKAIRLEIERVASKAHRANLSQANTVVESQLPNSRHDSPRPPIPDIGATYANNQPKTPPGYT